MASSPELVVTTHASAELDEHRKILLDVYEDVYRERLDDPFFSTPKYWERLQGYASRQGFAFTMGRLGPEPVGYALGYTLPAGSGWWRGLKSDVDPSELNEDGHRTFALNEIMVLEQWRRRGFARRLHDQLLVSRAEKRATLLVLPDNTPAQAAYVSWGWRKLGNLKPFDDSPTYDAMVLPLPIDRARGK
jgi:ribosomal protein S18 acetylase RimI-like enzyme